MAKDTGAGGASPRRGGRERGRALASVALVVLGLLLAPVAVAADWAETQLVSTDAFVATYRLMDGLACDILISAHPDNAGEGRYNDSPGACRTYVERSRGLLATRLANERNGTAR